MPDPIKPEDRGAEGDKGADLETKDTPANEVFDTVFDEAAIAQDKADLSAADDPEKTKTVDDPTKVVEPPVVVAAEPVVEPTKEIPVVEKPVVVADEAEKNEQRFKTLQGIHKKDKDTWDQEKQTLLAQVEEAKKTKTPDKKKPEEEAAENKEFLDNLTAEEKEELDGYEKDFQFVSKMEGIKRTKAMTALQRRIDELEATVNKRFIETEARVEPALKVAEDNIRESHYNTIKQGYIKEDGVLVPGHSDYQKYVDDGSVLTWIEGKPEYLRTPLKRVAEKGSAQDVIDMLSDFKRENNIQNETIISDNVIDLDAKKAAKKAALTVVETRKGAVNVGGAAAETYEDAWDEAKNKLGG